MMLQEDLGGADQVQIIGFDREGRGENAARCGRQNITKIILAYWFARKQWGCLMPGFLAGD